MDVVNSWPVVTRTLLLLVGTVSCLVHAGILDNRYIIFHPAYITKTFPDLWRLITAFCLTGSGLSILFDCYFLFTYSNALEKTSPRFTLSGSYFIYILFNMSVILLIGGFCLKGIVLLQPLILALTYTYSQDRPQDNVSIYFLTFPAKYLPLAMLGLTFATVGWNATCLQATGYFSGHFYGFITRIWPDLGYANGRGTNWLSPSPAVQNWFRQLEARQQQQQQRGQNRTYGQPGAGTTGNTTGTATGGFWSNNPRGPGRRLGTN